MSKEGKYSHINFTPPESVRAAAKRGLEARKRAPKSKRGGLSTKEAGAQGIGSGVARASSLAQGEDQSPETVRMAVGFFSRHSAYKHKHKSEPDGPAKISWDLWGGDAGKAWFEKVRDQMDAADKKKVGKSVFGASGLLRSTTPLYRSLATRSEFVVHTDCPVMVGECLSKSMPQGSEVLSRLVGKNAERNRTNRPMGGYCSTQQKDRMRETLMQKGLLFQECVDHGWYNDNHMQNTGAILGFPVEVELHEHEEYGVRWFTKGFLLEGEGLEDVDKVWYRALSLAQIDKRLSFSVEGSVIERKGPIVLKAIIRNIAITGYPVNTGCDWDVFLDAMEGTEGFLKSLSGPFVPVGDGTIVVPEVPGVSNTVQIFSAEGQDGVHLSEESVRRSLEAEQSPGSVIQSAGRVFTLEEAAQWFREQNPAYTEETISTLVDFAICSTYTQNN